MATSLQQEGSTLCQLSAGSATGSARPCCLPTEFRLFRPGINPTCKGPMLFDEVAASRVMQRYRETGHDLFFDLDHRALERSGPTDRGKSYGWFNIETRDTSEGPELWCINIRWTDEGSRLLSAGEYRYFSPVIYLEIDETETPAGKGRRILELINVALTNLPAMKGLSPLQETFSSVCDPGDHPSLLLAASRVITQEERRLMEIDNETLNAMMASMEALVADLADETVDPEERIATASEAVSAMLGTLSDLMDAADPAADQPPASPPAPGAESDPLANSLASVLSSLGASDLEEAETIISQLNDICVPLLRDEDTSRVTELLNQRNELRQKLAEHEAEEARAAELAAEEARQAEELALEDLIVTLTTEGRLVPAQHEWARALGLESLTQFADSAPVVVKTTGTKAATDAEDLSALDDPENERWCKLMGLRTPEQKRRFIENKRKNAPNIKDIV